MRVCEGVCIYLGMSVCMCGWVYVCVDVWVCVMFVYGFVGLRLLLCVACGWICGWVRCDGVYI